MGTWTTFAGSAVALLLMGTVPAAEAQQHRGQFPIRLSNQTTAPGWAVASARDVVTSVYGRAGFEVKWVTSGEASPGLPLTVILANTTPLPSTPSTKSEAVLATALYRQDGCGGLVYVVWSDTSSSATIPIRPTASCAHTGHGETWEASTTMRCSARRNRCASIHTLRAEAWQDAANPAA